MKVAIFGATGLVGAAITKETLARGYEVTILTRDVKKVRLSSDRLKIIEGDVTDRTIVQRVLEGQDAVIQSLGIGGKGDGKPTCFVSDANRIIMDCMEQLDVRRFIAISAIGAGNSWYFLPWIYRQIIMPVMMGWFQAIIDDKNRMEPEIEGSGLLWTIVRCTTVKDIPGKGRVTASLNGKNLKFSIAAPDMAKFVVDQLTDRRYELEMPVVSN